MGSEWVSTTDNRKNKMRQQKEIMLVDYSNLLYRVHFANPNLATSDGRPTSVVHGVLKSILSLGKKFPDSSLVFCCDSMGTSWRRTMCPYYKAQRKIENSPDRAIVLGQIPTVTNILEKYGFRFLMVPGFEADDIIAVLSSSMKIRNIVRILSSDKDFYQLIDTNVIVLRPLPPNVKSNKVRVMKSSDVENEFGIPASDWAKFRALMGDPSDNIKPLPGIGPKKALLMLKDGVDPSIANISDLPKGVLKKYPVLFDRWTLVREAYILSNLREHQSFSRSSSMGVALGKVCKQFLKDPLREILSPEVREDRIDKILEILSDYELEEIIASRNRFWQMR